MKQEMTTRREFIKQLAVGGVAIAVAPHLLAATASPWETVMPQFSNASTAALPKPHVQSQPLRREG
jgi:hypothetical protein